MQSRLSSIKAPHGHRVVQFGLLVVIASYLVTTVPGVRAHQGYSWWMDGVGQNLAYFAVAGLCLTRIPASTRDRTSWRLIALGLTSFGLSNVYYLWFVRTLDPMPVLTLWHALWWTYYLCVFAALMLMRPRINRLPLSLGLDGLVVGLGAATAAAVIVLPEVVAVMGANFVQAAITLVYPLSDLVLLASVAGAVSLFRWRPPPSLRWLAGGVMLFGVVDCTYVVQAARGTYESGGIVDAAWMVAVTVVALAPGRQRRADADGGAANWLPLTAPLLAAAVAITVLAATAHSAIAPIATYLAAATLAAALGRLAVASFEARRVGEQAHLAQTDDLTGLLNRRGFYKQAAAALAGGDPDDRPPPACALLLLDLDHFKDVNDSLGHDAGDELLRRVAARLGAILRDGDILARLGGDEFALLLPLVEPSQAVGAANVLATALDETIELEGLHVQADASIGIAICPADGQDLGTLLRHADIAMYRAKRARLSFALYTDEAAGSGTTRAGIELLGQLRQAIQHRDLAVHYQPKLSLRTGRVVGVEALVRWQHPERGLLYPNQFLPLARHNALMHGLTEFVVQRALTDAAHWRSNGFRIPVAVNLFPPSLGDLDLPARLQDALDRHDLTSADLTVEITEDFVLGNLDRAQAVLCGLRAMGVSIAIDNFGSGYSSLHYLRDLPIDEVKLDRSFIAPIATDARSAAIVRSVIEMSQTLGLATVAEGVETSATAAVLKRYGCEVAQGHFYSAPLSACELLLRIETAQRLKVSPEATPA